jgi:hypothetical protein
MFSRQSSVYFRLDLIDDSGQIRLEIVPDKKCQCLGGLLVIHTPDARAQVRKLRIELEDDLRIVLQRITRQLSGKIGGQGIDSGAADADRWAGVQVFVVEVHQVAADDRFDFDFYQLGVLLTELADVLLQLVRERPISNLTTQVC